MVPGGTQSYIKARLTQDEGRAAWQALFHEVRDRRLMLPSLARTIGKVAALAALFGAALGLAWLAESWSVRMLAWLVLALLLAQFAFVGHDAGHGSAARRPAANRALGQVAMTLVTGLAFDEWIGRHREHHRFCQDEDKDPDMAVAVVASLTVTSARHKGRLGRFMTRHQGLFLWLLALLFGHSQRHQSQAAVLRRPDAHPCDAAFLALHFGLWFGVPCGLLDAPFSVALLTYLAPLTFLGPYLAGIFWVNHVGMPLVRGVEEFSFFEHQAVTSRSILNPPAWNWLFGGLNFQVEHHLFPQVPSARLPAVQAIVLEHFTRLPIRYNGVPWRDAVSAVAAHLRTVARRA